MTQNRAFPSDNQRLLTALLRIAPLIGGGTAALLVGYRLGRWVPQGGQIYLMILFFGILIGMIILENEPGWNVVLFLSFSLASGVPLFWSGILLSEFKVWILFLILVLISLAGSVYLKLPSDRFVGVLFPITVIYILGWILLSFYQLEGLYISIWIVLGLVLFTFLNMGVLSRLKTQYQKLKPVPQAIEFYIVLYNLFWLSGIAWQLI